MGSRAYTCQKGVGQAKREGKSEIDFWFLALQAAHTHLLSLIAKNSRKSTKSAILGEENYVSFTERYLDLGLPILEGRRLN